MWGFRYLVVALVFVLLLAPVFAGEWDGPHQKPPIRFKGGYGVPNPFGHSHISRQHAITSSTDLSAFTSLFWKNGKTNESNPNRFDSELKEKAIQVTGRVSSGNIYPRFTIELRGPRSLYKVTTSLKGNSLKKAMDMSTGSFATLRGKVIGYYLDDDEVLTFRLENGELVEMGNQG